MADELDTQSDGVGTAATSQDGVATTESTTEATGQATDAGQVRQGQVDLTSVNLTDIPAFRAYQAQRDRAYEQLRQQVSQSQAQQKAMQQQFDQARLANAEPDEVAEYYRSQYSELQSKQQAQQAASEQQQQIVTQVQQYFTDMGIAPDAPGITWPEEINTVTAMDVMTQAGKLRMLQLSEQSKAQATQETKTTQAAQVEALKAAGVTKVNTGVATPPSLQAAYDTEAAALRGTGDFAAMLDLKDKYRHKGLGV